MQLKTRPTTCLNSKIVCWDTDHTFFASIQANILLHPLLKRRLVSKNIVCSLRNWLQECCRISVKSKLENTLFPPQEQLMVLLWKCGPHSDCCCFQWWPSFLDHSGWCLVWIRAGFSPSCENFLHKWGCCPFLQRQIVPNRVFDKRIDWNFHWWVPTYNFGDSVSMVSRLLWNVVLPNTSSLLPRLDQCAHYHSTNIPIVNYDLCEVVYTLCIQVLMLLNHSSKVGSRSIAVFQLLLYNLLLVTLEQGFAMLLVFTHSVSRSWQIFLVCQVCTCQWMSSGSTLQKSWSPTLRLQWRCYFLRTIQTLRTHVRPISVDSLLVAPTETTVSKILFAFSARMKSHKILRQRLWDLEVWLAQSRSCVCMLWTWWSTRILLIFSTSSLRQSTVHRPSSVNMLQTALFTGKVSNLLMSFLTFEHTFWMLKLFMSFSSLLCVKWNAIDGSSRNFSAGVNFTAGFTVIWALALVSSCMRVSNKNLTSTGLDFFLAVTKWLIALGSPKLCHQNLAFLCNEFDRTGLARLFHRISLLCDHPFFIVSLLWTKSTCWLWSSDVRSWDISSSRCDMFLSRRDANTTIGLQECVWCVTKPKKCVNCVQRSCCHHGS